MNPILNTTSIRKSLITDEENICSLFYPIKKIIENELINKISNFDALQKYINESKNILEKISYVSDTNFSLSNGEGFPHLIAQLDLNSINEEMINWLRNLIYSFPELLDQQDNENFLAKKSNSKFPRYP